MNKLDKIDHDKLRLEGILQAIADVEHHQKMGGDEKTTTQAIIYNIMIIGEAVAKLSNAFKEKHTHISWAQISGMRNRLIHEYRKVLPATIHEVINQHLPTLKRDIAKLHAEFDRNNP